MAAEIGALGANRSVPADACDYRRARLQRARTRLTLLADWLAAAVAVSLPWSTSATSILIVLWLMAALPTLESRSLRWAFASPAGALPVLLWALGLVGMLWSDVSMSERLAGLSGYHKLLVVPLLLAQFRGRREGKLVLLGFMGACTALLVLSWALVLIPDLPWRGRNVPGVPVKDYILQSALFSICAFGLMGHAAELWHARPKLAVALTILAAVFVANILFIETARTTLVFTAVLLLVFALRRFAWKGAVAVCLAAVVIAGAAWFSSSYLRERVWHAIEDVQTYGPTNVNTSAGQRFEYWRKSLGFIREAPLIGHGTGSIPYLFRSHATPQTHPNTIATNPHNQVLVIAIELGVLGTAVLVAMWSAHLLLFRASDLLSWFGLIVVLQNIISSCFNSNLFDFTQGWLYVFAVGVLGGMVQDSRPLDD
jgi:O-antigen ligase